jgi:hypothetical protein
MAWIPSQSSLIEPFRSKVQYKKTATIFNAINRIYNLKTATLEKFALPFLITVPVWLTWNEFCELVYQQAKRFIDFSYIKRK